MIAFTNWIYINVKAFICAAMSMQREFFCCYEIFTKQLGLILLVSLMLIAVVPFQLMSILCAGRENSYKAASKLYSLTAYKTTASGNTQCLGMVQTWLYKENINCLSTTKTANISGWIVYL